MFLSRLRCRSLSARIEKWRVVRIWLIALVYSLSLYSDEIQMEASCHAAGQNTPNSDTKSQKIKTRSSKTTKPAFPTTLKLTPAHDFLKVHDAELWLGKYQFNNIGVNIPDLFSRFLNGDETSATQAMQDAHAFGVRFVRCDGCVRAPETFRAAPRRPGRTGPPRA